MVTGPGCDFGKVALQEVITVTALSTPMTVRALSVPSWSIARDVIKVGTVNTRTNNLTCCESTPPSGGLCASACSLATKNDRAELRFGWGCASEGCRRKWAVDPGDCQQLQGAEVLGCGQMTEDGATEAFFDFGGTALQEIIAVNGPSILLTAGSFSEPKCSVEEDVIRVCHCT